MRYFLFCILLLAMGSAAAGGDAAAGEAKANAPGGCVTCHGPDGNGTNPTFPKLAGQYEDYLLLALKSYTNQDRRNAIMQGIVAALTEQDMRNLAAYYAELESELKTIRYTK